MHLIIAPNLVIVKDLLIVKGKVHVFKKQGKYIDCKIQIPSGDAKKIEHLAKRDVYLLVIPTEETDNIKETKDIQN